MDEAKMSIANDRASLDADPWLMDDSCPYDIYDLKNFPLPIELAEKFDALADEIFGPVDEVPSAA